MFKNPKGPNNMEHRRLGRAEATCAPAGGGVTVQRWDEEVQERCREVQGGSTGAGRCAQLCLRQQGECRCLRFGAGKVTAQRDSRG